MARAAMGLAACLVLAAAGVGAYYVPGTLPHDFKDGDEVNVFVNKITSTKTATPYAYYSLPVCKPDADKLTEESISLGEILTGDRIFSSVYKMRFQRGKGCTFLCAVDLTQEDVDVLKERIEDEYTTNWIVDNLPAAMKLVTDETQPTVSYRRGSPLGAVSADEIPKHYLFNHIKFVIKTREETEGGERIVGFEVEPFTVKHEVNGELHANRSPDIPTCDGGEVDRSMDPQTVDAPGRIIYSYSVVWERSDVPWSQRWDLYLRGEDDADIHWYSIVNSLIIVFFLAGMIAMIMLRVLHHDIARINDDSDDDETGWKLVASDVFRPPTGRFGPMMLSVLVGSGVQILCMTMALMVFAVLGVLSPANRGGLATAFVTLFVIMGSFAGYVSARLFKMFSGKLWMRNAILTAAAFPGFISAVAFSLNLVLWARESTLALPFGTMVAIVALWFFVSTPLVFLGSYIGFTRDVIKNPGRVQSFSKPIPTQPWYLSPVITCLVGGVLPFGSCFIELYRAMSAIWMSQPYYLFGFLALVVIILSITCAEISIVMCYFQLCSQDHHWWWRSFLTSGSSAVYVMLYAIIYQNSIQMTDAVSLVLYYANMSMISAAFFLLTGAVGFLSTLSFVRAIYGSIKVD